MEADLARDVAGARDPCVDSPPHAAGHELPDRARRGTRAQPPPAHGRAPAGERDPDPPRAAQAGSQGRPGVHRRAAPRAPRLPRHGEGVRPAAGGAQVRAGQGEQGAADCRISPSKTIGGLSERQRTELAAAAQERGAAQVSSAPVAQVFVITGPSGVGKGTLIRSLRERLPELELSVSATTRPPRPGERDGVDYHFLDDAEFARRVDAGEFVEHATYSGRRYGTLRSELERRTAAGTPVVLEIELDGARQVRRALPDAVQVFIAPPSREALRARLVGRGTDDPVQVQERLRAAEEELAAQDEFAHVVVNDRLEDAVGALTAIVRRALAGTRVHCEP